MFSENHHVIQPVTCQNVETFFKISFKVLKITKMSGKLHYDHEKMSDYKLAPVILVFFRSAFHQSFFKMVIYTRDEKTLNK